MTKKILLLVSSFLLVTSAARAASLGVIHVQRAMWSGRDVTTLATQHCEGNTTCLYKISRQYIGEPADEGNRSFAISWTCSEESPVKLHKVAYKHDSEGKTFNLECNGSAAAIAATQEAPVAPVRVQKWDPRSPLKYQSSFHSLMMADKLPSTVYGNNSCLDELKNYVKSGKNFYSDYVVKYGTMRIDQHPNSEVRDLEFFHWTKNPAALKEIALSNRIQDIFLYLRDQHTVRDIYFYIASDSSSSSYAGNTLFRIQIDPESLIYIPEDKGTTFPAGDVVDQFRNIHKELKANGCNILLLNLILEASHVGYIAYFGINNYASSSAQPNSQFFEVLGEWAFRSIEYVKSKGSY